MNPLLSNPILLSGQNQRALTGFTLVELLTVVTILGVLAMIAAPSFSALIASQQVGTAATDLYLAMGKSRSEATKRNANVWLCPKTSGTSGWKDGWRIQSSDCSDLTVAALDDHASIKGATTLGPTSVAYQSSGRVQGNTAPAFTITVSSAQKYVCIDLSGRPMVQSTSCL